MDFEEEEEVKWVKHYSSNHRILLVGEGDFSFSTSMALYFGSASNIVATSLDTYGTLVEKYKKAKWNMEVLFKLGACVFHGVDATKMRLYSDLKMQKFDRIIFNFPHAGFHGKEDDIRLIMKHKKLVLSFFSNASGMLRADGEVHVTHKTSHPFSRWNIVELAWRNSLGLVDSIEFKIEDYPGYNNKRGDCRMRRCDEPFPLGRCSTFKFRFFPAIKKMSIVTTQVDNTRMRSELSNGYSFGTNYQPTPFHHGHPETCLSKSMDVVLQRPLPIGSNLHGFAYGTPRFDYEKSVTEAFGRRSQPETCLSKSMDVVLQRPLPIGRSNLHGFAYGTPRFDYERSQHSQTNPNEDRYQRYPFGFCDVQRGLEINMNDFPGYNRAPLSIRIGRGSTLNAPDRYFSHVSREAALIYDYERSVGSASGRLHEVNVLYQNGANEKAFGFQQHYG